MTVFDTIHSRRSVRSFDGKALRTEDAQKIMEYAGSVGNPYDLQIEWRLLDATKDGLSSPVIVGTDTYFAGKMQRVPHAEEAFGYAFEKIVLFAESLGVGTTWIAGTMDRSAFEKAVDLRADEVLPCISPLGYPAKKMSLRETMMRKGVKADSRMDFGELFFDGDFNTPLTVEKAGALKETLEAVRLAPSAVNKQPWRIVLHENKACFYEKRSLGRGSETDWDIQKIDIGIALCHFELAAKESGLDVSFEIAEPQIPAADGICYIASYALNR